MKAMAFVKSVAIRMVLLPVNALIDTYQDFRSEWTAQDHDDFNRLNHIKRDLETMCLRSESEIEKK